MASPPRDVHRARVPRRGARRSRRRSHAPRRGGSDGTSTLRTAEEFNYAAGTWREVASMSRPRARLAAASVGERTFAVGGYDGAEYLDLVEAFTPGPPDAKPGSLAAAGSWTKCTPLSAGRSTMGLAACQGTLYAVGGFAAPHYLATVEAYDPRANQWWGCAPLAAPRRDLGLAAVEHRNTLVCAGGYDGNAYLGVVEGSIRGRIIGARWRRCGSRGSCWGCARRGTRCSRWAGSTERRRFEPRRCTTCARTGGGRRRRWPRRG